MRYVAWFIIALDLMVIAFWFVLGAIVVHNEPQNTHEITIAAFHVVAAPASLFLAAEYLWRLQNMKKEEEGEEEETAGYSNLSRGRLFAWIVLFTLLLLPDILVMLKEIYSSNFVDNDIQRAALGLSICFVVMSSIAWIWMALSAIVIMMSSTSKGDYEWTMEYSGSEASAVSIRPRASRLNQRKSRDSRHSWA